MKLSHTMLRVRHAHLQSGFTLVELMVAMAIALFLLGGLLTIVQNVRKAQNNQQLLAQLQDQERFAMTILTDVIQAGGYYPDPQNETAGQPLVLQLPFAIGEAFQGTAGPPDTLAVRYTTAINDNVILCNGSTNTVNLTHTYSNQFKIQPAAGNVPAMLECSLDNGPYQPLVSGVEGLKVWYGVKRDNTTVDYNADTYLTADQMNVAGPNGDDWANVSSVRIQLTFTNPLKTQPGQPLTIVFDRFVQVMGRAGVHT